LGAGSKLSAREPMMKNNLIEHFGSIIKLKRLGASEALLFHKAVIIKRKFMLKKINKTKKSLSF
jgi:hypothetical protein